MQMYKKLSWLSVPNSFKHATFFVPCRPRNRSSAFTKTSTFRSIASVSRLASSTARQPSFICHRCARELKHYSTQRHIPDFAFAFDIDGVLVRGHKRLPGAKEALTYLQQHSIPFILLTNGGGYHEERRAELLSAEIGVELDPSVVIQSHTPFADMDEYKDKTCLVVGGEGDHCRQVAQKYGFTKVVTTSDIFNGHPGVWPFSKPFAPIHSQTARQLPGAIRADESADSLKIDAIFVYNDPRDWGLDITVILDALLSRRGYIGTLSAKNGDSSLPNQGYQQDGQPTLFFSNADLIFAADFPLPRLGQGGFREALQGVWNAVTGGPDKGVDLLKVVIGKPFRETYLFAEKRLYRNRSAVHISQDQTGFRKIFMIGDNPESDIKGANSFESPTGAEWSSILVRTGVYQGGQPSAFPTVTVDGVLDAVRWGVEHSQSNK